MNKYRVDDYENALECIRINKYSRKAKNVFYYAPDFCRQEMYAEFEENPDINETEFMKKYSKIVYFHNFKILRKK